MLRVPEARAAGRRSAALSRPRHGVGLISGPTEARSQQGALARPTENFEFMSRIRVRVPGPGIRVTNCVVCTVCVDKHTHRQAALTEIRCVHTPFLVFSAQTQTPNNLRARTQTQAHKHTRHALVHNESGRRARSPSPPALSRFRLACRRDRESVTASHRGTAAGPRANTRAIAPRGQLTRNTQLQLTQNKVS